MNEHIDILLTSAKMASRENPWASIATHAISSGYNAAMIGKYRYELGLVKAGVVACSTEQVQSLRRDLVKHCLLGIMDIMGFLNSTVKK